MIPDLAVTSFYFSLPVTYSGSDCYFPNCCAEMGGKLWKNQESFHCSIVYDLDLFGQRWWGFSWKEHHLLSVIGPYCSLLSLLLKQAVLQAQQAVKSNCLRLVSHAIQPFSPPSAHAHILALLCIPSLAKQKHILWLLLAGWSSVSQKDSALIAVLELLICMHLLRTWWFLVLRQI